jgi:hypothetical protein
MWELCTRQTRSRSFTFVCMAFYVYRDGYSFGIAEGDQYIALELRNEGKELFDRPLETKEEAEKQKKEWQHRVMAARDQGLKL